MDCDTYSFSGSTCKKCWDHPVNILYLTSGNCCSEYSSHYPQAEYHYVSEMGMCIVFTNKCPLEQCMYRMEEKDSCNIACATLDCAQYWYDLGECMLLWLPETVDISFQVLPRHCGDHCFFKMHDSVAHRYDGLTKTCVVQFADRRGKSKLPKPSDSLCHILRGCPLGDDKCVTGLTKWHMVDPHQAFYGNQTVFRGFEKKPLYMQHGSFVVGDALAVCPVISKDPYWPRKKQNKKAKTALNETCSQCRVSWPICLQLCVI